MSEVYDRASLSMSLADYAVTDQLGKLHVIGGGLQVLARDHRTGMTAAFALVVSMTFSPDLFGEQYAFEVVLEQANGAPVRLGNQAPGSMSDLVRFGQSMTVEEPNLDSWGAPRRAMPAHTQIVVYFNAGLPLPAGRPLLWRARIDGESKEIWTLPFFVPGPPATPVIG
ncbi:MAG: hypothetical protein ABJA16_04830 [Nakamurella sp.]